MISKLINRSRSNLIISSSISKRLSFQYPQSLITTRFSSTYNESNGNIAPDLSGLEHRWSKMKEFDQADILDYLNDKSTNHWNNLTQVEKRALYYIYYGPWGPRSKIPIESVAAIVLKKLTLILIFISLGIIFYNYAIDIEDEENFQKLINRVDELKQKEKKDYELQQSKESSKKSWWLF
ncbi:hypothetical protein WICMUC_001361 [Wickerhamomyces mucosus]|uniref:Uncharacterized protein n=1 Tax=Wickerhamomyces mucosus TaxID=1378264 RepID=A0A9P8PVV2_9ASCO|nr:hypothetical protein WICMUC_001361 [Wickerhamomyces mucosus]